MCGLFGAHVWLEDYLSITKVNHALLRSTQNVTMPIAMNDERIGCMECCTEQYHLQSQPVVKRAAVVAPTIAKFITWSTLTSARYIDDSAVRSSDAYIHLLCETLQVLHVSLQIADLLFGLGEVGVSLGDL